MRFFGTWILAALLTTFTVNGQIQELTLDQCLAVALSQNPTVRIADMDITKADYSRKETLGQLLPSLSFDGSYNRTLQKQVTYMDFDAFGDMMPGGGDSSGSGEEAQTSRSMNDGFKVGRDNMYSLGFQASIPLVAPQLWASLKLGDIQIARSLEQARASRLDLVNQVKNAYYALQLAKDSQRVVKESYDMAALTHDIYTKRLAAGDASEYEVLRTSVAMKNIEPELIQCDIAVSRASLQLAILMGIESETQFTTVGDLSDYESGMYEKVLDLNPDLSNNTTLIMNDIDTKNLRQALKVQKSSLWPTLGFGGNYNWNSSSNGSPFKNFRWTSYSMVGLSLSIPLYQGGQRLSRIRQAEIQLEQMAYTRQNLNRTLDMQARLAIENITLNVKQIASSRESVREAERAHDIQQKSFEIGATTYLDLRDSELSLTRARLALLQAIYNYMVADSDLELLLGNAPVQQYENK
ncbi:MAG: TolC family protein [Muribaculaceae bacterium]|nr:TolC family protein [Muribaculaceae bacterium]